MARLKTTFLLLSFLLAALLVKAQNVTIEATSNLPNELIRVVAYPDMVSWKGQPLAQIRSDKNGQFKLQFFIPEITYVQLFAGLESVGFYAKPGASYQVVLQCQKTAGLQSYFEKIPPALVFKKATDNKLQEQIDAIDQTVNAFLLRHFDDLYRRQRTDLVDTLALALGKKYNPNDLFLRKYATYKIASAELAVKREGAKGIADKYFERDSVQYNVMSYMDLFNEVFTGYLVASRKFSAEGFRESFRKEYPVFREYLRRDPLLAENSRLAELIVLVNLQNLFNTQGFSKNTTLKHLAYLQENAQFAEHRIMAANLISQLQLLEPGTTAPNFSLLDISGKAKALSDYKDQAVVLQFVNSYCNGCESTFAQLEQILNTYTPKIQLITIATADSYAEYQKLFERNHYKWPLLNLAEQVLVLEAYQVKTFPEYILINRNNKIALAPASAPDQYLDIQVSRLLNSNQ